MRSRADLAAKKAIDAAGPTLRTFDEVFGDFNLTPAERTAMVWHLAAMRARKTIEALLPPAQEPFDKEAMLGVLREHRESSGHQRG